MLPIILLSIFTIVFGEGGAPGLKIDRFAYEAGIFFEHVGTTRLSNSDWQIIIYFDLSNLKTQLKSFKTYINDMDKICGSVSDIDSQCLDLVQQFQDEYNSYEEKQDMIFNSNLRFRKGLINGLGTVAKYLLGTLDAGDAEYYNNQITCRQNNDQHVLNLIKNQTTLVDSTIKLIRADRDQILNNFKVLGLKLDGLSNQINRVHDEIGQIKYHRYFQLDDNVQVLKNSRRHLWFNERY